MRLHNANDDRWTPHATVAVIVYREEKFLLVEEMSGGRAVFNQPAGHIDEDEAVEAAAIRETLEETGYTVKLNALLGLYVYQSPTNKVTYHRYCYIAEVVDYDETLPLDQGIIGPQWMSIEEIRTSERLRSPLVLKCFEDYLLGKYLPLDAVIEFGS